jgi:hypothetical protein
MSDRMTSIRLPGTFGSGVADHGRRTVPEMIKIIRRKAEHDRIIANAILAAPDGEFLVETYEGIHVRRNKVVLQDPALTSAYRGKSDV